MDAFHGGNIMKTGEARGIYSSVLKSYNEQKFKLSKQREELKERMESTPVSTHFSTTAGSAEIFTPSASNTSPAPLLEEMERLPCFATGSPAAATTNADVVEILNE